eukprot:10232943-Heterocapsa_arctica.AAC.1
MRDDLPDRAKAGWHATITEAFDQPNSNGAPRTLAAAKRIMSRALHAINGNQPGPEEKSRIPFPNDANFLSPEHRAGLRPYSPGGTRTKRRTACT